LKNSRPKFFVLLDFFEKMIKIITGSLTQFFEKIEPETLILLGFFAVLICQRGI